MNARLHASIAVASVALAVTTGSACSSLLSHAACNGDANCPPGDVCVDGTCTASIAGEGEGEGTSAGEGEGTSAGEGEGSVGEGEGSSSGEGEGEGAAGEGEGEGAAGEGEGEGEGGAGEGEGEGAGDPCSPQAAVTITSSAQASAFGTCSTIDASSVTITGGGVIDLTPLAGVTSISGDLTISASDNTSLSPLAGLVNVGGNLTLTGDSASGGHDLNALQSVGGDLVISGLDFGTQIHGYTQLTNVGHDVQISDSPNFTLDSTAFTALFSASHSPPGIGNQVILTNDGNATCTTVDRLVNAAFAGGVVGGTGC